MSTDVYFGNIVVRNNTIDLAGAKLINLGEPVNGNDVPSKVYLDTSLGDMKQYTDIKVKEQSARIDAVIKEINNKVPITNELASTNDNSETTEKLTAIMEKITITDRSHILEYRNMKEQITEQNATIETLRNLINSHSNDNDNDNHHSDADLINRLNTEIYRAQSAENALGAKCDILQNQVNHLFSFFFGTDASVPLTR